MEKNFTLMKTLTAFLHLLFPASRKNSRAVRNDQTPGKRSGTATTAENKSIDIDDAKHCGASFLFFNEPTVDGQQSTVHSPQALDGEQTLESKTKEGSKKINDELALGSSPTPLYKNWKQRVNDDLAACSPIVMRMVAGSESVIASRESVTVINDLKNIFPTTIVNDKTRTNKNDAWLPFASFCFSHLCQSIGQLFCSPAKLFKNQKPVLLTIPIRSGQTRKPNYNDGTKL